MNRTLSGARLSVACLFPLLVLPAAAQRRRQAERPAPDVRNAAYGPHARNVLDLWRAKSESPTPLVVYIHGGGFRAGDKRSVRRGMLARCLAAGISVAAINYRLSQHAPFPAPMLDSGRAIQFLRANAEKWNLDPNRFAATGGSAGAGISLWLGFHDDLADPRSEDPIARESTRLTCMAVIGAQSSYDPRFIKQVVGGRAHQHPALPPFFGLKRDELDTARAHRIYERASPINYVTRNDPPVFLYYSEPRGPLPPDARPGQGIHHPNFGVALKKKLDPLGITCVLRHRDEYRARPGGLDDDMVAFFRKHFGLAEAAADLAIQSFVYKTTEQVELALHVHLPPGWKATDRRPAIVFFFGGGWTSGSVRQFEPQARYLSSRGMVAARADYRVRRRHRVRPDACVEDAKSAVRWLRANCKKLGVDPGRIVAAGGSAGGHIAACTALTPGLDAANEDASVSSRPNALVLFNPVLRLFGDPRLEARVGGDKQLARRISPALHVTAKTPPALLLYGDADRLLAQGREYVDAARKAGSRADLHTAPGVGHGFFNRSPWRELTLLQVDRFLEALGYVHGKSTIRVPG